MRRFFSGRCHCHLPHPLACKLRWLFHAIYPSLPTLSFSPQSLCLGTRTGFPVLTRCRKLRKITYRGLRQASANHTGDFGGSALLLRILVADDHEGLRTSLKAWLETHAGWQVCGEATDGLEAVQKAAELKPDVIILDLAMPKMDGLQAASQISSASPTVPILVYTNYSVSPEAELEAKKHGVREVINKGASPNQLANAVELLHGQRPQSAPDETLPDTEPHAGTEEAGPGPG